MPQRQFPQPMRQPSRALRIMAGMGPSGRAAMGRFDQRMGQAQNRQAQIRKMLIQYVQAAPDIDLNKVAPPETDFSTFQSVSEFQKQLRKQQKDAERQGQVQPEVNRLPGLVAGGQTGPAREILGQLGPEELAGASRQLALQLPGARMDRRQTQATARREEFKALPDGMKVIEASGLSGPEKEEARRALVKLKTVGATTAYERIMAAEVAAGKMTPEAQSTLNQAFLLTQASGAAGFRVTMPDGTVISHGGSGVESMKDAERKAIAAIENTRLVRGSIDDMVSLLRQQPLASGLSSRITGAAQSALGISQSMQDVFNSSVGFDLMRRGQVVLREELMAGNQELKDERFSNLLAAGPEAAEVETRHLLLALAIAGATRTGTGRLSVKVVDQWLKDLNPKTVKGRNVVIRKLLTVGKELSRKEASNIRKAKAAGYTVLPPERTTPGFMPSGPIKVNPNAPIPPVPGGFIMYEQDEKGNYQRVP